MIATSTPTMHPSSLVRLGGAERAPTTLVCFAGAGAPVASFGTWAEHLPEHLHLVGVERAGHGARLAERPSDQLSVVVDEACGVLRRTALRSVVLVGHSAGSLVAHGVAHGLTTHGGPSVAALFALNGRSPTVDEPISWSEGTDENVAADLVRIRPELAPLFARPDAQALFVPALRADLELYRREAAERYPPVECPVVAVGARGDRLVPAPHLWAWRDVADADFIGQMIEGDHFALLDAPGQALGTVFSLLGRFARR